MEKKGVNVTITNLSKKQLDWLKEQSDNKAMSYTAIIKILIEEAISKRNDGFWS